MATSTHATILVFLAAYAAVAWPLLSRWALWRDLAAAPDEWRGDERAREIPSRSRRRGVAGGLLRARRSDVHPPPAAEVVLHPGPSRRGHGGHRLLRHGRHEPLRPAPAERQGLPPGRRRGGAGGRRPAVPEDPARGAHAVRRRGLEEARRPRARRRDARGVPPPAPAPGERGLRAPPPALFRDRSARGPVPPLPGDGDLRGGLSRADPPLRGRAAREGRRRELPPDLRAPEALPRRGPVRPEGGRRPRAAGRSGPFPRGDGIGDAPRVRPGRRGRCRPGGEPVPLREPDRGPPRVALLLLRRFRRDGGRTPSRSS